jgi:hypothetical protein
MRATVGLPYHLTIWEYAPFLVACAGIAAVGLSAGLGLGRRAALYTTATLLAIGSGTQVIMFEPDDHVGLLVHIGTLCIALLVVWRRASSGSVSRRRLFLLGAGLSAFTAAGSNDLFLVLDGLIPFVIAACLWWWLSGTAAARTVGLFAVATAAASLLLSEVIAKIMHHAGFEATLGIHSFTFIQSAEIETSINNFISSWVALGNGTFFGTPVGRSSLVACGVPKLDRALERGGLPLSRGRSLPALLGTRGLHASVGFERLLAARTLAASAPDRIKAPHRLQIGRGREAAS